MTEKSKNKTTIDTSRRAFIQGLSLSISWLATAPLANTTQALALHSYTDPVLSNIQKSVVIYNDSAHFDATGLIAPYIAPTSQGGSNRRYTESISEQEFLSRHWFS